MSVFFDRLFSSGFMPHGYCYLWKPGLVGLHVVSDSTITLAYYLIPIALFYFVRKRRDLPFNWMFVMFAVFILGCGTTHLMEVWTVWHGTYWLAGAIKAVTAAASVATAALFVPLIPRALALPNPEQLRHANQRLEGEIEERRRIEMELKRAHDELEIRVHVRTAQLMAANAALQKQASLLELAHDAILVRGMDDKISYWNSGAEETYGWPRDEALGKVAPELLGSEYSGGPEDPRAVAVREGRWEGEASQRRKDGAAIVVACRWALLHDEDGNPSSILQINTDITRQKQAVEALRESEERWRAVFEHSAAGIALTDPGGRFVACNAAYRKMIDYTAEELRGIPAVEVTHPEDREATRRSNAELLAGQRAYCEMEKRYLRKGGDWIWVRVHASVVRGNGGAPRFVMAIAEDITERKRADEEMRKLAALVENSTDFIGISSVEGQASFVNATGRRLVGLEDGKAVQNIPIVQFLAAQDRARFESEVLPVVQREGHWEGETLFRNFRTDETIPVWQHVFFITEEASGTRLAMATISRDIRERKRSEQNLQAAQAELAHMARVTTVGELAASIAHEVNQPLAAIVTSGNACLRWLGGALPNLEEARVALNRIVREGNRAADVIGRIRSLLRKSPPEVTTFDMNEIVQEVLALTNHEIRRHGVSLHTELAPALPAVTGDSVQLRQALLNLIMNAIDASAAVRDGPRELVVSSATASRQTAGTQSDKAHVSVVVAVRDSGPGIKPQDMDKIFTPFFTTKAAGMGMGLAITRSAVEAHGGRLWATGSPGGGATFQFSVPSAIAA